MMRLQPSRALLGSLVLALGTVAAAQQPTDTLYLQTGVGSFKLLPPGPDKTRGTLDVDFEGTIMVSGLSGTVTPGAGVRLEYERKDHNRQVYFGKGHIRVSGEFRGIQFFGRNLKGSYNGVAVARLYGEFDKNMETGYFWYASQPEKQDWGAYGRTLVVPPAKAIQALPKGKVRDVPGNKAG